MDRLAAAPAARDDRDLVDDVAVLQDLADDPVSGLVVGDPLALLIGEGAVLLLGAGDEAKRAWSSRRR